MLSPIEAVSVTSEYAQDGGSIFCCYDTLVQNSELHGALCLVTVCNWVRNGRHSTCHAEQEYPQDGGMELGLLT